MKLTKDLNYNEEQFDQLLGIKNVFDIGKKELTICGMRNLLYSATFLVNAEEVTQILLNFFQTNYKYDDETYFNYIYQNLSCINVSVSSNFDELVNSIFNGLVVFLINYSDKAIIIDLRKYPQRGLSEPDMEKVVRGSKEGFCENIAVNIGLIRRRIKTNDLVIQKREIGTYSKTLVSIIYLKEKVNQKALNECIKRIDQINVQELTMTDKALEELLTTRPFSIYPMVRYTERPDTLVAHLYQGQFAILVDTSPSVMLGPTTFFDHLQAPEEYRQTPLSGTYLKLLRMIGIFVSFLLVPLWLCFVNQLDLNIPIMSQVLTLEFSKANILFQVLMAEITIEMVRMASIHTPNSLSQSMGLIVGIILGGIAVNLGIVSETIVLLGALSAIGTYITPSYELALANKIVKLVLIIISYFFGLTGLIISLIGYIIYLATLKSFSMPYFSPLIPFHFKKLIKELIRLPYRSEKKLNQKENGN